MFTVVEFDPLRMVVYLVAFVIAGGYGFIGAVRKKTKMNERPLYATLFGVCSTLAILPFGFFLVYFELS